MAVDTLDVTPATDGSRQRDSRLAAMILVGGLHLMLYAAFRFAFTRTRPINAPPTPGLVYLWTRAIPEAPPVRSAAMPSRHPTELTRSPERTPTAIAHEKMPVDGAPSNPITIDWASEAARSAAAIAASRDSGPGPAQHGSRPADSARRRSPSFQWDKTVTERIEPIPGGGTLIKLNDHCGLTFTPLPMLGCWLGHREPNGHLFDDMNNTARPDMP
jgi:hypothetical protein